MAVACLMFETNVFLCRHGLVRETTDGMGYFLQGSGAPSGSVLYQSPPGSPLQVSGPLAPEVLGRTISALQDEQSGDIKQGTELSDYCYEPIYLNHIHSRL